MDDRLAGEAAKLASQAQDLATSLKSAQIAWDALRSAAPDVIVIAPCGYDVERARVDVRAAPLPAWWDDIPAVRTGRVFVMDGNAYISRPGPRVVEGAEILARLLHPDAFADGPQIASELAVCQHQLESIAR